MILYGARVPYLGRRTTLQDIGGIESRVGISIAVPREFFFDAMYVLMGAVPARLEEAPPGQRPKLQMQTSTHQPRQVERVGVLKFNLQGQALELGAFTEAGDPPDRLFVPFADATSGAAGMAPPKCCEARRYWPGTGPRSRSNAHDFHAASRLAGALAAARQTPREECCQTPRQF
jgi:hypothetical protein